MKFIKAIEIERLLPLHVDPVLQIGAAVFQLRREFPFFPAIHREIHERFRLILRDQLFRRIENRRKDFLLEIHTHNLVRKIGQGRNGRRRNRKPEGQGNSGLHHGIYAVLIGNLAPLRQVRHAVNCVPVAKQSIRQRRSAVGIDFHPVGGIAELLHSKQKGLRGQRGIVIERRVADGAEKVDVEFLFRVLHTEQRILLHFSLQIKNSLLAIRA